MENRMSKKTSTWANDRELILTRTMDAPPELVFKAWTAPEMMKHWFVPKPWSIARVENDVRPGGASLVVMRDPEGNEYPNPGVYLEVVKDRLLVVTDAYTKAWEPSEKPFMTAILSFDPEDEGKKTLYKARVLHWNIPDREAHEKMGFHEGWATCAEQLADYLATLQ
jgi:uncharacterized protein YndB with AHSA1/START domain